ncbi:unnamed protein product [Blepharisma stoltei]|uniref:Alpha-1,4 glucan phosphorylase n=1 Tax=Blepharisma stoltei TaxID=1481888 RepID=A0AAU9IMY0_9CILI|nr:unnamed protein product [Blepharisma stoltei]
MKVIFIPNYSVSIAELIIPATDLSEQISTAGTEASGTSNMKFVMNGGVIIGTMDGANVEIAEEIGEDNMFIFGARIDQVQSIRESLAKGDHPIDPRLRNIFTLIREDRFGNAKEMASLLEDLEKNETYLLCHDFSSYVEAHERSDAAYKDKIRWNKMSISGALHAAKFSSDRSIEDYSELIWNLSPVTVPTPAENPLARLKTQPHLVDANTNLEKLREIKEHKEANIINAIEDTELIDSLNKEETMDRRPTTFQ